MLSACQVIGVLIVLLNGQGGHKRLYKSSLLGGTFTPNKSLTLYNGTMTAQSDHKCLVFPLDLGLIFSTEEVIVTDCNGYTTWWEILRVHRKPIIRKETKSTIAGIKLPEFVFGVLDRLVRVCQNTTILTNEAFLMFSFNKTGEWLTGLTRLPPEERDQVIEQARRGTMEIRQRFADCKKEIGRRSEALAQKKLQLQRRGTRS